MRYVAESGPALVLAYKENISVDIFGVGRLASKNLVPDPTLSDFEPDGSMRYWPRLEAPPVATGRNVYVREPGGAFDRFTRQNASALPQERASYKQTLALVNGAPMSGFKSLRELNRARPPILRPVPLSDSGYPAGDYLRSYAWAVKVRGGWLLTAPAPWVRFTVAEDQTTEQPIPEEIPEGVDGIALLDSEPIASGGRFARLFVQRVIDVRSFAPQTYPMDGPPRYGWMVSGTNETYVGAYESLPGPRTRLRASAVQEILGMDARVSFKFRTPQGWSASQGVSHIEHRQGRKGARFEVRPHYLPPSSVAWVLQVQSLDNQWHDVDYGTGGGELDRRQWAGLVTDDPEKTKAGVTYESAERSKDDETGIPDPDEALEAPLVSGKARIGSGRKVIRTTDIYTAHDGSEIESPPSAPVTINLGLNEGFEVDFREAAEEGDVIPNGTFEEQVVDPAGFAVPRRFSYPAQPHIDLTVSARESVVTFDDATGRTTTEDILRSGAFDVFENATYTIRGGVILDRAQGGSIQVYFRFLDSAGGFLGAQTVASLSAAGEDFQDYTFGPSGSGAANIFPAGTRLANIYWRLHGSTARNLAGRAVHVGMFRGLAFPRKASGESPVPETEPETAPYPPGSYMRVVENPSWAQGKGNGFEYYGSALARLSRRYFASGLQLPVEANRTYCLQADYYHEGLQAGSEALPVAVMNARGEVLQNAGAMLPGPSGDGSGLASIVIETGPGASYVEVQESTLGAGLLRAWGFQLAYGTVTSPWTDEVAPSGVIAAAFDTRTPGVDETLARIFSYKRLTGGGAVVDLPAGTSCPVRFRGRTSESEPYSAYYSDITTMPNYRHIEVEASPASTAATATPEISALFAEAEPPRTVLLKADGSEYPGGVLVEGVGGSNYGENTEETMRSDGVPRVRQLYPARGVMEEVTFKAFSEEAVEAVSRDSTHGRRLFVVKGWGKTRLVRFTNVRFGVNRQEMVMGRKVYVHTAEVSGRVLLEEDIK